MKIAQIALFLIIVTSQYLRAQEYEFQIHRFCDLQLDTTPGHENIEIKVYPKAVETTQTLFKSNLKKTGHNTFETADGLTIVLIKLPQEIINDHNRRINSGQWLVSVLGSNKEYLALRKELVSISTFRHDHSVLPDSGQEADMSDMSYLGSAKNKEKMDNKSEQATPRKPSD